MASQLEQFFKTFDPEGSVDREDFRHLCARLNICGEDADMIFEDLDSDGDGKISFSDFSEGFSNFMQEGGGVNLAENTDEATKNHVWTTLTSEAERVGKRNSDEGKLKWLLNELRMSEQRHLVPYLEGAVEELMGNLEKLQGEKSRLEETFTREKHEHDKHLKRMEEELDHQVKEAETKMRMKAQEEVEDERKTLQSRMDSELDKLQSKFIVIEKVYSWLRTQPSERTDNRLVEVRSKLDDAERDNRKLRMSLRDTQTSIALMRSEMLQLRTMYEDKCREVNNERERVIEALQEQDHLSRQLNLLQETNKRLFDQHDIMRNNMETSAAPIYSRPFRAKSGSIIGDYLDVEYRHGNYGRFVEDDEDDDDYSYISKRPVSAESTFRTKIKEKEKPDSSEPQSLNQSDSGVSSSVRDATEIEDEYSSPHHRVDVTNSDDDDRGSSAADRRRRVRRDSRDSKSGRPSSMPPPLLERHARLSNQSNESIDDGNYQPGKTDTLPRKKISEIKKQLGIEDRPVSWNKNWPSSPIQCSTPKDRLNIPPNSPIPMPRTQKVNPIYESIDYDDDNSDAGELSRNSVEEDSKFAPLGSPEHSFKVIFVGDAGVGKSSFALRISKGVFVRHMSSTLGLDFLTRALRVDGKDYSVQLWDTAGQERFRSITKTYFRKADGVMLLYDCTCEHSFLNVRQWVEDIDVSCFYSILAESTGDGRKMSAPQRIPLMIVANKTDLRDLATKSGRSCITTQQGEKLSTDCGTTFAEASAKDGTNVLPALVNLVRAMIKQQELHETASTMELSEAKEKKSCC